MHPTKAPGPDGFHARFFQLLWHKIEAKLSYLILGFLNDAIPFEELNETFITLIPKIKNPEDMVDFRPISLCNVVYKILSKMLVNRIKPVLESSVVGDE